MKELLERLRRNAEYAGGASDREASREAASLIEDLCKKIAAQDKLGEQVCVFNQWLDAAAEQLDAGIGKGETASEGSLALTAAAVKLAEIIAGPDESDDPTAEQYLARAKERRQRAIDEKTQPLDVEIERLRAERDAIVKELDETREKHLREARAADEARDEFETLKAKLAEMEECAGLPTAAQHAQLAALKRERDELRADFDHFAPYFEAGARALCPDPSSERKRLDAARARHAEKA